MKLKRYSIPYYKPLEYELEHLQYDRAANKVDHPSNSDPNHPIYFKDCSDAFAGATQQIYVMENVHYEQMMIQKETERIEIPTDGFYENISTGEETDYTDEVEEFQNGLLADYFASE